jgi:hypothetical protein
MPPPPPEQAARHDDHDARTHAERVAPVDAHEDERPRVHRNGKSTHNGSGSLEDQVFEVLAQADHPLSVAAIRKRIGGPATGQQIRRILERASDRVQATSERPAAYTLR